MTQPDRIIALYLVRLDGLREYGHILYALTDAGAVWLWGPSRDDPTDYVWRRLTLPYDPSTKGT